MGIKRKILIGCPVFLVAACAVLYSAQFSFAQTTNDIPSDLSLDLNLAQQNPAPEQKQILQAEFKQAVVTTAKGETSTVTPQDSISPQAKTESSKDTVNPDQTTSEQVQTKPVSVEVDEKGSPVPSATDIPSDSPNPNVNEPSPTTNNNNTSPSTNNNNTSSTTNNDNTSSSPIPGTSIPEHNDNAAPPDNSTNPNLPAPSAPVQESQPIPLESQPAPLDNNSPDSNPDNSSVQGVKIKSSGSLFQRAIAKAFSIFNK